MKKHILSLLSPITYMLTILNIFLVTKKLLNFDLGIIKTRAVTNLDQMGDYYVELTKADLSLNRYKVVS